MITNEITAYSGMIVFLVGLVASVVLLLTTVINFEKFVINKRYKD